MSRTSCNDARRKLGIAKWVDLEWPKSMQKMLDKLWEMTFELKESVFSSLLDSVEMKLWEPVDMT